MPIRSSALVVIVLAAVCFGQTNLPDVKLWARFTLGQVVSSQTEATNNDYSFEHEWLKTMDAGVRLTRPVGSHLLGRLHFGVAINYNVNQKNSQAVPFLGKKFTPYLLDAALQSTFAMRDGLDTLQAEFGYFPFKYNAQSTNLGEYMFRTGTYPGYIISGFENSIDKPKVCGLRLGYTIKGAGTLRQDLLLTTEMDVYPLNDISLTYMAGYTPHPFADISAGIQFARFISVDERKTTPWLDDVLFNASSPDSRKWIGYIDTATGDTTKYTFSGIKCVGRFSLDPQAFFTWRILGKEDLKLYAEGALLGEKNYAPWYMNRYERIPVMFGLNFPAFRLLDVLSLEAEWYGSPYWNSQENIWTGRSPVPYTGLGGPDPDNWQRKTDDRWKWSVYASRKIGTYLRISGQVASDHTPRFWYTPGPPTFVKYTEMVPRTKDWYYMMRMTMYF